MKRETLISELTTELRPVSKPLSPVVYFVIWAFFSLGVTSTLIFTFGELRPGYLATIMTYPRFSMELSLGMLASLFAAYFALQLSHPGRFYSTGWKVFSIAPFGLFCGSVIFSYFYPAAPPSWEGWRFGCEREILAIAALPMLLCLLFARRAYPLERRWVGVLAGIASATPAATAMHLACAYLPSHQLLFHLLPVLALAWFGSYLGTKVFQR